MRGKIMIPMCRLSLQGLHGPRISMKGRSFTHLGRFHTFICILLIKSLLYNGNPCTGKTVSSRQSTAFGNWESGDVQDHPSAHFLSCTFGYHVNHDTNILFNAMFLFNVICHEWSKYDYIRFILFAQAITLTKVLSLTFSILNMFIEEEYVYHCPTCWTVRC